MRHRLQCPSGPERGGKEAKPTLRVLHRGDLSRLPHRASFHLEHPEPTLPPYSPGLPGRSAPAPSRRSTWKRRKTRAGVRRGGGAGRGGARRRGGLQVGRRRRPAPHLMQSPFRKAQDHRGNASAPAPASVSQPHGLLPRLIPLAACREESGSHLPAS